MSLWISQKLSNFPKYNRNKIFSDFCLVHIHLILEALKLIIWEKFVKKFYIKNFGNSVVESKLAAEAGRYLLLHIVQGTHHLLITLKNVQYPRVYMWKENRKSLRLKPIPNLNTDTGIDSVDVIDFFGRVNTKKLIKIVCKLDKKVGL